MLSEFKRTTRVLFSANDELTRPIVMKQDDVNGRSLKIQITDDGTVQDLTGAHVYLAWVHESYKFKGIEAFVATDATKGIFELEYPETMQRPGILNAYIQICYNSRIVNTVNFKIIVQDDLGIQDSIDSEGLFVTIKQSISEFMTLISECDETLRANEAAFNAQLAEQQAEWDALKDNVEEITGVVAMTNSEIDTAFEGGLA